jgi:hypothetical protein
MRIHIQKVTVDTNGHDHSPLPHPEAAVAIRGILPRRRRNPPKVVSIVHRNVEGRVRSRDGIGVTTPIDLTAATAAVVVEDARNTYLCQFLASTD